MVHAVIVIFELPAAMTPSSVQNMQNFYKRFFFYTGFLYNSTTILQND
jgi:hypothetical protein